MAGGDVAEGQVREIEMVRLSDWTGAGESWRLMVANLVRCAEGLGEERSVDCFG